MRDILEAIDHIELFLDGVTFEAYQNDLKTKSAVERQMQILTEASIRLGNDAEAVAPARTGRGFEGWETSCGTHITGLTIKLSGIASRMSFHHCVKLF